MIFKKEFKVNLSDINRFNKMKLSAIMGYFQESATSHSDSAKDGIYYVEETKGTWVVINWKIKIYNSLKWNEEFVVTTWSRKIEKIYAYRDYKMCSKNGEVIAIGSTKWVYLDLKTNSIKIPPENLMERYQSEDIPVFDEDVFKKLKEPENKEIIYSYTIQKRDIDWNQHVNNVAYVDIIAEAIDEEDKINELEILYKKECKYGRVVDVFCTEVSPKEKIFTIKDADTGVLYVLASVVLV